MEIKGIDVSAYQGTIDWEKVANYGMGFAILRITEKGNTVDKTFEQNYKGCIEHKIPVGVYKFSYAKTESEAQAEADSVINTMNGRSLTLPVFIDLEWSTQKALGSANVESIALAFLKRIQSKSSYKVGIYCNADWYNNVLTDKLKNYDCWIARYPSNDNGEMQERLKPSYGIGWQYSSKATIPGIPEKCDRSVFWKDYSAEENTETKTTTESEGTSSMDKAIEKMILIAKNEIGYLEKKSNSNLDSKTANAGSANYTKYWRDIKPDYQGQPWCACFVTWVFVQAFGQEKAKKLLKHYPYVYCPTMANLFTLNANPTVGDIVIFKHNGTFTHTGIVTAVIGDTFYTIEGNTSGASGIIANGGGVCAKSYKNSEMVGTKFCTPDYSLVSSTATSTTTSSGSGSSSTTTSTKKTPSKTRKFVGKVTANTLNVRSWAGTENAQIKSYPTLSKGNLVDVCDTVQASDKSGWYYVCIASKYYGFVSAKYIEKQ